MTTAAAAQPMNATTRATFEQHTDVCQGGALQTLAENLCSDGIDRAVTESDPIPEWDVANAGDLLAAWLSDGTADCYCPALTA